jgi:hypothetical protein
MDYSVFSASAGALLIALSHEAVETMSAEGQAGTEKR